jgi:group I intron endonuclease
MKYTSGIYKITNPKGAIYIGSSKHIEKRFAQYKNLRSNEQHKLRNSINKYGYENHNFEILEECELNLLLKLEREYCIKYDVLNRKNLNLKIPKTGENQKCFSEDVLIKMSKIHKGKEISLETRKKISLANTGKKRTEETRLKISIANKGEKNSMYGKTPKSKGQKMSAEFCRKNSEARKGKFLLGENNNAKKVVDLQTNIIYDSAKEVSLKFNINYSTLKSYLNNRLFNKTNFKYLNK